MLDQVRWETDGPWIPESVTNPVSTDVPKYRDGMHSGIGGLAVPPRYLPDARINDMTLGTAAVLLGALWAHRTALAERAAAVLLAEAVSGRRVWTGRSSRSGSSPSRGRGCLEHAGVEKVAGEAPLTWHRRCLHSVRTSGLPERRYPGFWDNDGRCCGTAGVGETFLDSWQRFGHEQDLEFAVQLADTLVERAILDGPHAYWRFIEHREPEPLLPPGVGWMQGAAGIASFLFRVSRIVQEGHRVAAVARMETWWATADR